MGERSRSNWGADDLGADDVVSVEPSSANVNISKIVMDRIFITVLYSTEQVSRPFQITAFLMSCILPFKRSSRKGVLCLALTDLQDDVGCIASKVAVEKAFQVSGDEKKIGRTQIEVCVLP